MLLLDLDGTVCVGDGPALRYADEVAARLDGPGRAALREAVTAFLDGAGGTAAQDVYQLVQEVATARGLAPQEQGRAYRASRAALLAEGLGVRAPAGLAELLAGLDVHVVVLTNAPADGLDVLLDRLGLAGVVDERIGDAGKPDGMGPAVDRLLAEHGIADEPGRLLSVGDLWANDLRAPRERGCATAYIDRFDLRQGPADARAATFEELYGAVRAWASGTAVNSA
ncbi:HAD family hydrolase [Pseudonocardia hydrocarbonoxydans]|uniref:HAD family hydrolase n=1 Tax=Pseudonocardia hydrocarbonoxydans TaxID=76726 RepID=UPI0014771FC2|nr:haloacid dehalogenase-like hydrolase [Pseudonocardia hydrocarbonoxydans]